MSPEVTDCVSLDRQTDFNSHGEEHWVVQSYRGTIVSPVSGFQLAWYTCCISCMQRIRTFLEDSDAASLRPRHRRRAQEIAARMSRTSLKEAGDREPDISS